jgi:hypothetical protein
MLRNLTLCACAMVAIVLLSSDVSACGRRRARCCGTSYGGCGTSYSGGYAYPGGEGYPGGYAYPSGEGYPGGYAYPTRDGYYNPGGIGGPRSGLGVRPGPGMGGLGPRR